jgi:Polyketide cyclase / dehydrase and lipid transport
LGGDIETLTTDMTVAHLIFRETFRSRVTLDRANGRILIAAADGLVRRLHGRWDFLARNAGRCEVGFSLSYELASRTLAPLMGVQRGVQWHRAGVRAAGGCHSRTNAACTSGSERPSGIAAYWRSPAACPRRDIRVKGAKIPFVMQRTCKCDAIRPEQALR